MSKYTYADLKFLTDTYAPVLPIEIVEILDELVDKRSEGIDWEDDTESDCGPMPDPRDETPHAKRWRSVEEDRRDAYSRG